MLSKKDEFTDWSDCLIVSPEVYNLYLALMVGTGYDSNPMCDPAIAFSQQQNAGLDSNPMCDPAIALRQRGSALEVVDLEPVMRNVTFSADHIKLQKQLADADVYSLEWSMY